MGLYENNPCFGCQERVAGCHGKCDKHQDWVSQLRDKQDVIYKQRNNDIKLSKFMGDSMRKRKKQKKKEM